MNREIFKIQLPAGISITEVFVREGDSLAIVGENGSGKGKLLKGIFGRKRGVSYRGLTKFSKNELELYSREITYFDGILYSNSKNTVKNLIDYATIPLNMLAEEIMDGFGVSSSDFNLRLKNVDYSLSIRLSLIQALASGAKLVLFDDVIGLDYIYKSKLIPIMQKLKATLGMSFVISTADFDFANAIAEWMLVIDSSAVVEYGRTNQLMTNPKHPYTQWLVNAALLNKKEGVVFIRTSHGNKPSKKACKYASVCPMKIAQCDAVAPIFIKYSDSEWTACHLGDITDSI